MRVAVLGCGYHGRGVAYQLGALQEVSSLIVADKDEKAALRVRGKVDKAVARQLDVTDRNAVAKILEGTDVVFNAVGPYYKHALGVIRTAIDHQVNYVDLNDDGDVSEELFLKTDYDVRAKEAGVVVLSGAGVCPGVTNVLAKYGSQQLDKVKAIHIRGGFSYIRVAGSWVGWNHMLHVLGEVTQFLGGKYVKVKGGEGKELVQFLDPLGWREVYYFGHSEAITLPCYIRGLEECTTKTCVYQAEANALLTNLVKYGFARSEPVAGLAETPVEYITHYMGSSEGRPYFDMETCDWPMVLLVEVIGEKEGRKVHLSYEVHDTSRRSVTAAGALAIESLIRGEISARGVLSLEGCVDPVHFLRKMTAVPGVTIYQRTTEEVSSQLNL